MSTQAQVLIDSAASQTMGDNVVFPGLAGAVTGSSNQAGTLTNAPVVGNPAFWMPISLAGTIRYVPCW